MDVNCEIEYQKRESIKLEIEQFCDKNNIEI